MFIKKDVKEMGFKRIIDIISCYENPSKLDQTKMRFEIGKALHYLNNGVTWGLNIVCELSEAIKKAYPNIKGFSPRAIWRMQQVFEAYQDDEALTELVLNLNWSVNLLILVSVKTKEEREFYLKIANKNDRRYTNEYLIELIKNDAYSKSLQNDISS